MVSMELENLKREWSIKSFEKDCEIKRLSEKLKLREHGMQEMQKLTAKIDKLKIKIRDVRLNYVANDISLFTSFIFCSFLCLFVEIGFVWS